jgi:TonB family protein
MRLYSGKKIGQSGYELVLAVFFSFFLHAALVVLALVVVTAVAPKVHIPPFYEVKLVGLPADVAPTVAEAPPEPPKEEPAPAEEPPPPPDKKAASKHSKPAAKTDALPELSQQKPKQAKQAEAKPVPAPAEPVRAPERPVGATGVAVNIAPEDSTPLSIYKQIMASNIERNWNPPPAVRGVKAKVVFRVLRTGRVFGDVIIEQSSGNDYFDMAARRAILASSPFPHMPEEFHKQAEEFSVDLAPKE